MTDGPPRRRAATPLASSRTVVRSDEACQTRPVLKPAILFERRRFQNGGSETLNLPMNVLSRFRKQALSERACYVLDREEFAPCMTWLSAMAG